MELVRPWWDYRNAKFWYWIDHINVPTLRLTLDRPWLKQKIYGNMWYDNQSRREIHAAYNSWLSQQNETYYVPNAFEASLRVMKPSVSLGSMEQ